MSQDSSASGAAKGISAASEERFIASTEEFTSSVSKVTLVAANVFQALLVAVVVVWVLDLPRQFFGLAFYTEQMLTVCLGLVLALAYTTETSRPRSKVDWAGAVSAAIICVYIAYQYKTAGEVSPLLIGGLAAAFVWTALASRAAFARWFDWACVIVSLGLTAYITVRYEALTYELAMLPLEGVIGSAILTFLVLDASRRISGWGFVAIILAIAIYVYISPFLPGDFQTRWVSPERMVAYLGLDTNSMIGAILGVAVLIVIPFTIMGQVLARTGGADFFADLASSAMGRYRGGNTD